MAKIRDEVGVSRLFTVAERVDVEAALLLLGAAPSLVRGKRWDVWPRLCSAVALSTDSLQFALTSGRLLVRP